MRGAKVKSKSGRRPPVKVRSGPELPLLPIADGADLFICECYDYARPTTGHMNWNHLQTRLPVLRARRIMITHMSASVLARLDDVRASGVLVAEDGLVVEV